ncbi:MAG: MerR family transcriptional regulator [Maritimibacter sp.]
MEKRIEEYTVGELARASGVSVRTLHHYDEIGLLKPAHVAANGYRLYRRDEALRLQEILFYRAAGLPLGEIAALLEGGDRMARLEAHRARLAEDLARQAQMLVTLDRTLSELKGDAPMTLEHLYTPFSPEKQAEYEAWLVATYGPDMAEAIAASKAHLDAAPDGMQARMAVLKGIEAALVTDYEAGLAPEAADTEPHRDWVADMWGRPCPPEAYAGLADMYLAHPDFIARYERLSPGFSQWLTAAMKATS